mmetsp:Transcript_5873/g.13039  ORF Transcript_5873/g.13039 Transcript_5873/m.13039 type:complete len:200 (-) Transcript_5873:128-727(-)
MFRLRHVCIHVLEVTKLRTSSVSRICVEWIPTFVNFHRHEHILLLSCFDEVVVVLQCLDDWLCHHHMHSLINACHCNIVVGIIGSKDDRDVSWLKGGDGIDVGLGVDGFIGWIGITSEIHLIVDVADILLHMVAYSWKLLAVNSTHANSRHLPSSSEIKHGQGDHSSSLVRVGCLATDVPCCVLSCTDHEYVGLGLAIV